MIFYEKEEFVDGLLIVPDVTATSKAQPWEEDWALGVKETRQYVRVIPLKAIKLEDQESN